MQILPVGVQSFRKLREENLLYIDKTEQIAKIPALGKYIFFSRPRRFGKSLMLSTLSEMYSGNKSLFSGLWAEENWNWTYYPVIYLDLNKVDTVNGDLNQGLLFQIKEIAANYDISISAGSSKDSFAELLQKLSEKGSRSIVLIDEYDKAITDYLGDTEKLEKHIATLKGFYGTMKSMDDCIHQAVITGVSKYGKLSIFSDLNNLKDVTNHYELGDICGLTEEEIRTKLYSYIEAISKRNKLSVESIFNNIKFWYDGYSWDGTTNIYNPFSVLNYLGDGEFKNYWFETGTPSFLIAEIKKNGIIPYELQNTSGSDAMLESADIDDIGIISLLYQTGYLTINSIEYISDSLRRYHLGLPNQEVRVSFNRHLLASYLNRPADFANSTYSDKLIDALLNSDWDSFFELIDVVLASVPYDLFEKKERFFHALVHVLLTSTGLMTFSEVHTKEGRMDTVLVTSKTVFIFEFKADKSAVSAMQQVQNLDYPKRFGKKGLSTTIVAIAFDTENRKVNEWLTEVIMN
jgi:hypothetical protein